jgi:hypothetical protein
MVGAKKTAASLSVDGYSRCVFGGRPRYLLDSCQSCECHHNELAFGLDSK